MRPVCRAVDCKAGKRRCQKDEYDRQKQFEIEVALVYEKEQDGAGHDGHHTKRRTFTCSMHSRVNITQSQYADRTQKDQYRSRQYEQTDYYLSYCQ